MRFPIRVTRELPPRILTYASPPDSDRVRLISPVGLDTAEIRTYVGLLQWEYVLNRGISLGTRESVTYELLAFVAANLVQHHFRSNDLVADCASAMHAPCNLIESP